MTEIGEKDIKEGISGKINGGAGSGEGEFEEEREDGEKKNKEI